MNSDKLIVSVYDYTGAWAQKYIDAGYAVILWDKKIEGCILEGFTKLQMLIEETGKPVHGFLFAPPCTEYASSGARWWEEKDKASDQYFPFENAVDMADALVRICLHLVDLFNPKFWVMENPVGRIEKRNPELKTYRKFSFDPCDFGDPYTKKTILWGEFTPPVVTAPVLALLGSMMHNVPRSENRQAIRSATPAGFAKAFYDNNK